MKALLLLGILIILVSCEKQSQDDNDLKTIDIVDNAYLPLDTNDLWIFKNTTENWCDVGTICHTITTIQDTLSVFNEKIIGQYKTRCFFELDFNTQLDKISWIIDSASIFNYDSIQIVDFLYTNKKDTSWNVGVKNKDGQIDYYAFVQEPNKTELGINIDDEIKLSISCITKVLDNYYIFKEGTGIIKKHVSGINISIDYELIKYINN